MNIFEDLIEELKDENLLEETVIETNNNLKKTAELKENSLEKSKFEQPETNFHDEGEFDSSQSVLDKKNKVSPGNNESEEFQENRISSENIGEQAGESQQNYDLTENQSPNSEKEFYRKRAMEEVTGLQMVEHVLSGVEREQMKVVPKNYDDLAAKKSLHSFMQVSDDVKSPEHAQAEFLLMQETESWCSALSHRDKRISAAHLRRYCETTRPPLSSQALISLARFYRNLPFSESVRSKFDLVVTRLFSKDIGGDKRILVFTRDELIEHLKELYAEWSSIQLYSPKDDDSEIVLAAMKFEDFMSEAESAGSFDELVKNDFFNRLRLFKEGTNELFYAPLVAATAIECNIRIGNKYVDLIDDEREKANSGQLQDKYGFLHDQAISDATSKTLQLVELLKERTEEVAPEAEFEQIEGEYLNNAEHPKKTDSRKKSTGKTRSNLPEINRFLLAATILVILLSGALYMWVNYFGVDNAVSNEVKVVNLDNSSMKTFMQSARISESSFYGITTPAWEGLSNDKKEELLTQVLALGTEKGFTKVHLIDKQGKTVGTASAEKIEVLF